MATLYGQISNTEDEEPKLIENWDSKGRIYYTDSNGNKVNPKSNLSLFEQIKNKAHAKTDNVIQWINETDPNSDAYKQKANIILAAATLPFGMGTTATKALGAKLAPVFGKKISQQVAGGIGGGLVSGSAEGFGRGIIEGENPVKTAAIDGTTGALGGGAIGLGMGKLLQKKAFNNLYKTTDSGIYNKYFDDYIDGLKNYQEPLADFRAAKQNVIPSNNNTILYDANNPLHRKQFEIIQNANPMIDDYHTGIRTADDIKTPSDVYNPNDFAGTPDWTFADSVKARKDGVITLYSSKPFEPGIFATPSKMEAKNYAGKNGQIYEARVPLRDYALIDSIEGQYAPTEHLKYNLNNLLKYKRNNYIINNESVPELWLEPEEYAPTSHAFTTYAMQNKIYNDMINKPHGDYVYDTFIDDLGTPHFLRKKY